MRQILHATATLVGMIVGVGLFAVPYVSAQAGFAIGVFWILLLGALALMIHLFFGEVVAGTAGKHRLAGYAERYLGHHGKQVVTVSQTIAFWGAQVAYLLVGGTFLRVLLNGFDGGSTLIYTVWVFALVALVTFFGLRLFDRVEFWMTLVLLVIVAVILGLGAPQVRLENLQGILPSAGFVPYGVVLFALGGAAAVSEMWEIVGHRTRLLRRSIVAGTLIAVAITLLFALVVVGISGVDTTEEAIRGLQTALGPRIVWLGALFGFFAVITSYLVLALYLTEMFQYDFRVKHLPAWLFAVWVPLALVFAGAQNFVAVLDIVGSVFGGFDGIMIVLVALAFFKRRHVTGQRWKMVLGALAMLLLAIGIAQKLYTLL